MNLSKKMKDVTVREEDLRFALLVMQEIAREKKWRGNIMGKRVIKRFREVLGDSK